MKLTPTDVQRQVFGTRLRGFDRDEVQLIGDMLRGYTFKGRLLRPSMVRVAVRS